MELKHADITEKIIGCAMKGHSKMGSGYPEIIYARCPAIEFDRARLRYKQELNLNVYYDEFIVGKRRVDFMVEEKIIVELKALADLSNKDLAQALNYLESHRQEIALLINFGAKSLQFKRIINNKNIHPSAHPINLVSETDAEYSSNDRSNHPYNPSKNPENPWS
jgi:GxxExxY protein